MTRLMLAGLLVAAITSSAFAGSKSACVNHGGETYCVSKLDSPEARANARKVHSRPGKEKLVDAHAPHCPLDANGKPIPADGQKHVVPCKNSPTGWCKARCDVNN